MKSSLVPGVSAVNRIVVDKAKTIGFMGEDGRVYATPYLIGDIETTCRNLILAHADANQDFVGMEVAVKHLAPKVTFSVTARDELDTVSSGTHARFVVDKTKTVERLKAKAVVSPRSRPSHVRSRRRDHAARRARRAPARAAQGERRPRL